MKRKSGFSFFIKSTAMLLLVVLVSEICMPSVAWAISGPSQTDYDGFTSTDTTEMVDLSTGDFKYDIPLMTVPGPDGGYPIVLSYNAGVGMNDEASWVGLGWNLNPGVINRQLRGLPDDFNGENNDRITKTDYIRDNTTMGLTITNNLIPPLPEVYGVDFSMVAPNLSIPMSYTMYYNTYAGLGSRIALGVGFTSLMGQCSAIDAAASVNLSIDSNQGGQFDADVSATGRVGMLNGSISRGITYNPRGGITAVRKNLTFGLTGIPKTMIKAGGSFATSSHIPDVAIPMVGVNTALTVDLEAGIMGIHANLPITLEGNFSTMMVQNKTRNFKPYGYIYSHLRKNGGEKCIMDYNRENDVPVNMKLPSLPVPVATNDIYTVKGVGGGSIFRAMRNDAGIYYTPDAYSRNAGASVGLEAAIAAGFKAAADINGYYSSSYTGKWRSDYANLSDLEFGNYDNLNTGEARTREPFYFRMLGEQTPFQNNVLYTLFDKAEPSAVSIAPVNAIQEEMDAESIPEYEGDYPFTGIQKFRAGIKNEMNGKAIPKYQRNIREKRTALVEYRTVGEIKNSGTEFFKSPSRVTPYDNTPLDGYTLDYFNFNESHLQNNHIGEFSVLQTDGSRCHYGIPAYNKTQKEARFSYMPTMATVPAMEEASMSAPLVIYDPLMHQNPMLNYSRDQYVAINEMSAYAHAHLLTSITSHDYVDLTSNGPSADDYGSYTKFNYNRFEENFKWRIPYTEQSNTAINMKGYLSVPYDNIAAFTYGTKEVWYLHSVETKTHIAFFITSDRLDGLQAGGENGGRDLSGKKLQKLDKIILFSKKDLELNSSAPKAIQTIDFYYSYDLCPNVPTNSGASVGAGSHPTDPSRDANSKKGKLTLNKVTITNESSSKGRLTPYVFEYANNIDDVNENPQYAYGSVDRWGTYRPDNYEVFDGMKIKNETNSYTVQDEINKGKLDTQASAWNLKKINTPSGGTIRIEYEADDYGYVQDRQAQQMVQIVGTGKVNRDTQGYDDSIDKIFGKGSPAHTKVPIRENYRRIYFRPEKALTGANDTEKKAEVLKYLEGIPNNQIYFKVSERLQIPKEHTISMGFVSDYVTGYMEMEALSGNNYGFITVDGEDIPYFTVKEVSQKGKNPLRVAGLQYLRYRRADLSKTTPNGVQNAAEAILGVIPMFFSSLEVIFGYYTWSIMKGHCEYLSDDMPSFVRLNSPDKIKYGGGHRVKKITVTDGWNEMTGNDEAGASYEQNFVYKTEENGRLISSGVASYEPEIGGDEIALKKPYYYNPDNEFINNDPAFFIEDPIEETYYPAPRVVYGKVLTYNSATENVPTSGSGISVTEHYTAKDYPTVAKATSPQKLNQDNTTFIPFIASIQFRHWGYSQAYSVEVNDMPGKLKAVYTYPSNYWDPVKKYLTDETKYLSFKKYIYNRTTPQPNEPAAYGWADDYKVLKNDDNNTETWPLGLDFEMFCELKESSDFSLSGGAQINGGVDVSPYMIFIMALPYFDYSENAARTVVTNKVIYRTGVLTEVISYNQGNIERVMNVLFDKETGRPLLTMTTSDYDDQTTPTYDKPTYNYDMPSHWYQSGMGGAYQNYRAEALLQIDSQGSASSGMGVFAEGDEVYCPTCPSGSKKLYVSEWDPYYLKFTLKDGSIFNGGNNTYRLIILRSGKRNLQKAVAGNVVSLSPPNGPGVNPLFAAFNQANSVGPISADTPYSFADCLNPSVVHSGVIGLEVGNPSKIIFKPNSACRRVEVPVPGVTSYAGLAGYSLYAGPQANTVYVAHGSQNALTVYTGDMRECGINTCMTGILNAGAVEYASVHTLFDPSDLAQPSGLGNYASGQKGIYRLIRSNTYFTDRKQSNATSGTQYPTFTGEDGSYTFSKFNYLEGNGTNQQNDRGWRWVTQAPSYGYTRDGKTLETQNMQEILSANLLGYNRNLVIASAVNASHREIGFDSFEEYDDGAYNTANVNGRLLFTTDVNHALSVTSDRAHTGKKSLKCQAPQIPGNSYQLVNIPVVTQANLNTSSDKRIRLVENKKYVLNFWVNLNFPQGNLTTMTVNGTAVTSSLDIGKSELDGWRRIEYIFTTPAAGTNMEIKISPFTGNLYLDDVRIQPFNSEMKAMVYDRAKYIPLAELDGRNYATFYGYDEEGKIKVIKKETENGVYTVGHTRSNIKNK